MNSVVISSNKYNCLSGGFIQQFNKYFPNQNGIIIGDANDVELSSNFQFVHSGKDEGKSKWSNILYNFINQYKEKYITLFFIDHFLIQNVDIDRLQIGINYILEDKIDKIFGGYTNKIRFNKYDEHFDIVSRNTESMSLMPSCWKTDTLRKYIRPNTNPNDIERILKVAKIKTLRSNKCAVFPFIDAIRSSKPTNIDNKEYINNFTSAHTIESIDQSDMENIRKYQEIWKKLTLE